MRRDTKAMTWRQRRLADNLGTAEGPFEDDPAIMHNRNDAPRLLGLADLVLEPSRDVLERGLQPFVHGFVRRCYHASRPRGGRAGIAARCSASCLSNIARAAALRFSESSSRCSLHQA